MIKIGLLGFGTVAGAFYDLVEENKTKLEKLTGQEIEFIKILVRNKEKYNRCKDLLTVDKNDIFDNDDINLIVEATGEVDEIATSIETALKSGVNVISANKALISKHLESLIKATDESKASLKFEGAVGGAIPLLSNIEKLQAAGDVKKIVGVLNGTSNFILSQMEEGLSFDEALKIAQEKGYAEADPSADIDGIDTMRKINITASLLFDTFYKEEEIKVGGIRDIKEEDLKRALDQGNTIKLIGYADSNGKIYVRAEEIDKNSLLGSLKGGENAILFDTTNAGEITIKAPGAGGRETAYSLVSDLIDIYG